MDIVLNCRACVQKHSIDSGARRPMATARRYCSVLLPNRGDRVNLRQYKWNSVSVIVSYCICDRDGPQYYTPITPIYLNVIVMIGYWNSSWGYSPNHCWPVDGSNSWPRVWVAHHSTDFNDCSSAHGDCNHTNQAGRENRQKAYEEAESVSI